MPDGSIAAADAAALGKALETLDAAVRAMLAEDLPHQLAAAQQAHESGDSGTAIAEVHAIRGSAGFCKLDQLHAVAASTENCLQERGICHDSGQLLDQLANAVAAVTATLRTIDDRP